MSDCDGCSQRPCVCETVVLPTAEKDAGLGRPYYQDELVTLYHGDCRQVTAWLEADVLVTDPPYGISWAQRDYLAKGRRPSERSKPHGGIANDSDTSARDQMLAMWGDGPALVFGAIEKPAPTGTRRVLVWKKPNDSGLMGSTIWRKDWEPIFVVGRWPRIPATESAVFVTTGTTRHYAQGIHPHAKPVGLLCRLIEKAPGAIADPFAGSGSTLVAAKQLGRRAIGIELDEGYCEIAAKRLAQDTLFGGAA